MTDRVDTFGFVGVTATQSSINQVFPRWARVLDLEPVNFDPIDLDLGTTADRFREVVTRMKVDPHYLGALVTTHKVNLLDAAADLFDELDPYAELCHEISCISKQDDRLVGHAKDPITAGQALDDFLPPGHFGATGGHVLCIGAGGSGLAIAVNLLTRDDPADRPERFVLVNRTGDRLEECARVLGELGVLHHVELIENDDPERNDARMAGLPVGSMIINATGMGKDRPGSPITDDGRFPERGIAWELNYRGELEFLHQARAQEKARALFVEDGWRYFVHGWSEVVAQVFDLKIDDELRDRLADEAEVVRRRS